MIPKAWKAPLAWGVVLGGTAVLLAAIRRIKGNSAPVNVANVAAAVTGAPSLPYL